MNQHINTKRGRISRVSALVKSDAGAPRGQEPLHRRRRADHFLIMGPTESGCEAKATFSSAPAGQRKRGLRSTWPMSEARTPAQRGSERASERARSSSEGHWSLTQLWHFMIGSLHALRHFFAIVTGGSTSTSSRKITYTQITPERGRGALLFKLYLIYVARTGSSRACHEISLSAIRAQWINPGGDNWEQKLFAASKQTAYGSFPCLK